MVKKIYYLNRGEYSYPYYINQKQIIPPEYLKKENYWIQHGDHIIALTYKEKLSKTWKPIDIRLTDRNIGNGTFLKKNPDITSELYGVYLLTKKAVDILNDLIPDSVELLEAVDEDSGKVFYFVNFTEDVDCLRKSDSVFEENKDGSIHIIKKHEFNYEAIKDKHLFKIKDHNLGTYVSDIFVQRFLDHKLRGGLFVPVWTLENGGIENPYFKSDENPDIIRT